MARKYQHSELQKKIIEIILEEGCIDRDILRKRLDANAASMYKALKSLERKKMLKIYRADRIAIVCPPW